jgi:O-antigen/teichoic acid export membrane protein
MTTTALPPILDPQTDHAAQQTPWVDRMPRLLRVWGIRSVLSIVDQGLTASVGFGVNVLLARWMTADTYGAFAVAFAGFLFVSGFHNAILLEPLTVLGPANHAKRLVAYFRKQMVVHALLVGALSTVILLAGALLSRVTPQSPLPGALLGSGLALPFLLLLWLVRRMCYVLQRPSPAVFGSIFYVGFVLAGMWLLHRFNLVSPFTAFILTGTGSLLSAGLLWTRIRLQRTDESSAERLPSWREVFRENWTYGRWLVGSTVLNSASTQAQMFIVAGTVGLGAAGILRAMQIPALVMVQIIAATGLLVLPAFSYDFGAGSVARMRHKANVVSIVLASGTLLFALGLGLFAGPTEQVLYGGKYADHAQLMLLLALMPVAQAVSTGYSLALRASQRPHFDLLASAVAAPAALVSAVAFIHWWGLAGAAASVVLSYVASALVTCWVYRASAPQVTQG